jgi:hypothetical protein
MRRYTKTKLFSERKITNFLPEPHFSPGLQLEITIGDLDLQDHSVDVNGRICFYHLLPGEQKVNMNFTFNKQDLINNSCKFYINSGDLVVKVMSLVNFKLPLGVNPSIQNELTSTEIIPSNKQASLSRFAASVYLDQHLDFVQDLRSLNPQNFLQLISRDLEPLEATIDGGSQQAFKKWAIADQIIRLAGAGLIPSKFVDWAVERYYLEYGKTKERLGIKEIIL